MTGKEGKEPSSGLDLELFPGHPQEKEFTYKSYILWHMKDSRYLSSDLLLDLQLAKEWVQEDRLGKFKEEIVREWWKVCGERSSRDQESVV